MIFKFLLKIFLLIFFNFNVLFSQSNFFELNSFFIQRINFEHNRVSSQKIVDKDYFLKLSYFNFAYLNSNLPNLENINGLYIDKGYGFIQSALVEIRKNGFYLSFEPQLYTTRRYELNNLNKSDQFSVLNDTQLEKNEYIYAKNNMKNVGILYNYKNLQIGLGNWNDWWGPGIHNSLVLSNNAKGFYNYQISTKDYIKFNSKLSAKFKYTISLPMKNSFGNEYFLTAIQSEIKYGKTRIGIANHIISGGYNEINWDFNSAIFSHFDTDKTKYWERIIDFYIQYESIETGLNFFFEFGIPSRTIDNNAILYSDHATGSNIGLRKYGLFGINELQFGFEYTRLVQGQYYNLLPTPNWYDNIKYNYSSYHQRRWAAHCGSDSDDFLIFLGYKFLNKTFIYGINYERHGVTYNFPPEVKFESRISISIDYNSFDLIINYENEYFKHYNFIDSNRNIWEQKFENGSIQRTNTLLFKFQKTLNL